jgi:hypothetical protein
MSQLEHFPLVRIKIKNNASESLDCLQGRRDDQLHKAIISYVNEKTVDKNTRSGLQAVVSNGETCTKSGTMNEHIR